MGNFDKPYEELLFTDNFMFVYMMEHYPDICREMLELLLPVKIDRIESICTEHSIENTYDTRGVRLDTLVKDSNGNIYDAEMQVVVESDLPKRSRYYHSAIDMDFLIRSKRYAELKSVYVIFICKEKLNFPEQVPIYFFRSVDTEAGVALTDMRYTVFVNSDYINQNPDDAVSEELNEFLHLINKGKTRRHGDTFANRIENLIKEIKEEKRWRAQYMTVYEQLQLDKDTWIEEGREEGRLQTFMQLVKDGHITSEIAAESLGITVAEFNSKKGTSIVIEN